MDNKFYTDNDVILIDELIIKYSEAIQQENLTILYLLNRDLAYGICTASGNKLTRQCLDKFMEDRAHSRAFYYCKAPSATPYSSDCEAASIDEIRQDCSLITNTLDFWTSISQEFGKSINSFSYICVACRRFEIYWISPEHSLERQNIVALAKEFIQTQSDLYNVQIDGSDTLFTDNHNYNQRVEIRLRFLDYCVNKFSKLA